MLRLAYAKKKGQLADWRTSLLTGNIGDSVERLQFKQIAPCVTPTQKYLWLVYGSIQLNYSPGLYLALQGIGPVEQARFSLTSLSLAQAQDLAGNAFTANICAAALLAILLYIDL